MHSWLAITCCSNSCLYLKYGIVASSYYIQIRLLSIACKDNVLSCHHRPQWVSTSWKPWQPRLEPGCSSVIVLGSAVFELACQAVVLYSF